MEIAKGFAIDDSETVIPWRITPEQLARITGQNALTEVTRNYFVTRCSALGGLQLSVGYHFQGRSLRQIELFRNFAMPLAESYADFQEHLETTFGPPTSVGEADCGFSYCEWKLGTITIIHSVIDRFGPEEHVRISNT